MGICHQVCSENKNSRKKKVISPKKENNNSNNENSSKIVNSVNILPTKVNNNVNNNFQNESSLKGNYSVNILPTKVNNNINNNFQNEVSSQKKQENKTSISKSFLSLYSSKNKIEKNILINTINKEEINDSFSESIDSEEEDYRNFFKETKYEKELNSNFKYFNIFWYAPEEISRCKYFVKCFKNVKIQIGYGLDCVINFFKKELISEWIFINEGYHVYQLLVYLPFQNIKSFLIYCSCPDIYDGCASEFEEVGCITSDPHILCEKLIELNKNYIIPNFNYKSQINKDILFEKYEKNSEPVFKIKSEFLRFMVEENEPKNEYNNLCIKFIKYYDGDEIENDFLETEEENYFPLYFYANIFKEKGEEFFRSKINELKYLTLLSLYFSKYPYIFNLLSFNEIKDLLNAQNKNELIAKIHEQLPFTLEKLYKKLMKNESILDEKAALKDIQIYCILVTYLILNFIEKLPIDPFNCYQIVNFFRDFDFSLKFLLFKHYANFNNRRYNFIDQIYFCLVISEFRYRILFNYFRQIEEIKTFTEEEQKIIKETLTIKDFIILGNNNFHEKIKGIEKNIKSNSFKYLNVEQISNYIEERKKENKKKIWNYFYFLIINYEEYLENFETIYFVSLESGISFLIFLYVENKYITKIPKSQLNCIISIIFVYSPEDIINYLSQKLNFYNPIQGAKLEEISDFLNIKIPKISFEQNDEDIYQSGCFELAETFDINLIKNNFIYSINDNIDFRTEFSKHIYYIYKDHNALDLFYNQNCIYFGWKLYPELFDSDVCYIKRFLYMYCREEKESQKSFYRIINDDLRSRDPYKIYRYISILSLINNLIELKFLKSFNGKVYRATKLDENLILKLVPGAKMINTTFWSTSKDFKVAEKFMIKNNWRNSFIICETTKNNIDIDLEKLNPFNEKEILFLPFTEFIIKKVSSEIKYGKKIFIIELTELNNRNAVNTDNMDVIVIKNFGVKNQIKNFWCEKPFEYILEELLKRK